MGSKLLILGSVMAFGMFGATSAQASYTSKCDGLIAAEKSCKASGRACIAQTTAIQEQCKCHAFRQNEWKLITAAVGKDGVCNATYPYDPPPPPSNPRPTHGNLGKGDPNIEGNLDKDRGGPEEGNLGRGNPK